MDSSLTAVRSWNQGSPAALHSSATVFRNLVVNITITFPQPQSITKALASDWAPVLRRAAGAIAIPLVAVYVAGLTAGTLWHQLLAWAQGHHQAGASRLGLPGASMLVPSSLATVPYQAPIVQRQAPAPPPPVLSRAEACRQLKAEGLSVSAIAERLKTSTSTVRRALKN